MKKTMGILATTTAMLVIPAIADAHVTVQPDQVAAESFARLDLRVPNETDDAATEKVEVQMPDGFIFASYEPVAGWRTDVKMEKTAEPIESHGESYDQQVKTITWTATDAAAAIQPGQFRDFGLSVGIPADAQPGDVLTFPALQTYDDGDVVRWIGDPDAEEPAATVTVTTAEGDHGATEAESAESDDDGDGAPTWLAILGVVLGAIGIGVGGVAMRGR
jgi:uncharacterized protein YcnI